METVLQGIPHVICYIDDILITGANNADHLRNLASVLQRLQHYGFRLKKSVNSSDPLLTTLDIGLMQKVCMQCPANSRQFS